MRGFSVSRFFVAWFSGRLHGDRTAGSMAGGSWLAALALGAFGLFRVLSGRKCVVFCVNSCAPQMVDAFFSALDSAN